MILLQALDFKFAFLEGADGLRGGLGPNEGGGVGDAVLWSVPEPVYLPSMTSSSVFLPLEVRSKSRSKLKRPKLYFSAVTY
jgi:hypothetical protein